MLEGIWLVLFSKSHRKKGPECLDSDPSVDANMDWYLDYFDEFSEQLYNRQHCMVQNFGGKAKKYHEQTIQKLLNRHAQSITGMYPSTLLHPLLSEAGLVPPRLLLKITVKDNMPAGYLVSQITIPTKVQIRRLFNKGRASPPVKRKGYYILLNHRQRQYACRLLGLPDQHPDKSSNQHLR